MAISSCVCSNERKPTRSFDAGLLGVMCRVLLWGFLSTTFFVHIIRVWKWKPVVDALWGRKMRGDTYVSSVIAHIALAFDNEMITSSMLLIVTPETTTLTWLLVINLLLPLKLPLVWLSYPFSRKSLRKFKGTINFPPHSSQIVQTKYNTRGGRRIILYTYWYLIFSHETTFYLCIWVVPVNIFRLKLLRFQSSWSSCNRTRVRKSRT